VGIIETSAALGACLLVLTIAVVLDRRPYRPGKRNYIPVMIIALAASLVLTESFAALVGEWARQAPVLKQRLVALSEKSLTPPQRHLLTAIYRELGGDEVMLAGVNLLQGTMSPYFHERGLETQFLERRTYGRSGSFVLMPRDAKRARAELFQAVLNDPTRREAAFSILGQVEVWRIEHGRPTGEPRHPMIESGVPWPPLSFMETHTPA